MRVALGLKARTGRALLVAVGGDAKALQVVERRELALLPPGRFAPYHAAEGLAPTAARASVERDIAVAHEMAAVGIRETASGLTAAGHEVVGAGVLTGPGLPAWSTDDILAVHVRMHQAEGVLFRDVLVAGVKAYSLPLATLDDKTALDDAARALGWPPNRLALQLAALGKAAGPPWTAYQKAAAAAALAALLGRY